MKIKPMRARYTKLAAFYFFYFAILGAYVPYWPLYLKDLGFAPRDIGELMAITLGTKIIAPYIWGWIGDSTHQRLTIIRLAALLATVSFAIIFLFPPTYLLIAITIFLFSFFWNALLPQFEVVTLDSLRHQSHHYSRIRLWGSIGFIVTAVGTAPLVSTFGSDTVPWVIVTTLALLWLVGLNLSSQNSYHKPPVASLYRSLDWSIVALLLISCLLQFSHGPYYAYFTIFMEQYGYNRTLIGQFWGLGVICEIIILFYVSHILRQTNPVFLLSLSIVATVLRWLLIGYLPEHITAIIFAQSLHAITFGVYHATMIHALSIRLPSGLKGRGQALYASLSFGVGGGLGTYIASTMWEDVGGNTVFALSAIAGGLALLLLIPLQRVDFRNRVTT